MSISSIKEERNKNSYSVYAFEIAVPWSAVAVPSYDVRSIHNPARHLTASVLLPFRPASGAVLRNNAVAQIAFFLRMKQRDNKVTQAIIYTRLVWSSYSARHEYGREVSI